METTIVERLEGIFKDILGDDDIQLMESTNAQDIEGWNSLNHISILAAVQDEFTITFDMDEIMKMNHVGDIVRAIEDKLK